MRSDCDAFFSLEDSWFVKGLYAQTFFLSQDGGTTAILMTFYLRICMLPPVTGRWFEIISFFFSS